MTLPSNPILAAFICTAQTWYILQDLKYTANRTEKAGGVKNWQVRVKHVFGGSEEPL